MLTAFLIGWPLISVLLIAFAGPHYAKRAAFASTLVNLGVTAYALSMFNPTGGAQFALDIPWIPSFGIHFNVAMDGISILMVLLTNLLMPLIVLSSFGQSYSRPAMFYSLMLFMQAALVGVFVSMDAFLYYVFWELALIPIYFIILFWGGDRRVPVTFKFFIYTIFGSLLMLVGFIYLYFQLPAGSDFSFENLRKLGLEADVQNVLFWAFFVAFAIKMPVFPFHTWQPDTYVEAPPQGTMLLSGIMLKMGVYSVIRWILPVLTLGVQHNGRIVIVLSIIGIVYGSWIAIKQNNFKRLLAYSSFAHVGLISAGIFSPTLQGLQGGMIQMISHGINVVGLFFVAQIIYDRLGTNEIQRMGGIINKAPVFAVLFMIVMLGSVALPLTNGFIGEFLLLAGVFQVNQVICAIAGLTIILGAVYMLRAYQRIMLGEEKQGVAFADLNLSETVVLVTIAALVLFIGIYPKPILAISEPAVKQILDNISPTNFSLK